MLKSAKSHPHIIVAVSLLLITLAVNISMPLFRVYTADAGLNNGETALVLAAYIAGMLPCYVFLGGISDRLGRKPVIIVAVISAFLATICITVWPNAWALIVARFFQGVAVGIGMGAGTAYMSELLHRHIASASRAAGLSSLFTAFGFGGGALATSISLFFHFTLTPVTYYLLLAVTLIGLMFILALPSMRPIGGKLIRLPSFPVGSLPVNVAIGICWAATGVVIAIIPSQLAKFDLTPFAGVCLVLINWSGAFIQPLIRQKDPLWSVKVGLTLVPVGFALVIVGCYMGTIAVILIGASVIGLAAYGFSYLGGLALIANLAGSQKARAVSGYMFVGYIGFGIPPIFLGYLADHFGIVEALIVFEVLIVLLSVWMGRIIYKSLVLSP
jgi:MFS family permease